MKLTRINLTKLSVQLSLVALASITSTLAAADESGWYAGAHMGQAQASIDDARIGSNLSQGGATMTSISSDNRDTAYKLFGGYQFNKNIALEGGYFDLGKFGFAANTTPSGTLTGEIKLRGLNLDVVGTLPITERFSVLGRIGANYAQASDSFRETGALGVGNPNPSTRETHLKLGWGLQYALTDSLTVRAEMERYQVHDAMGNKGDVDLVSLGLIYRFGAKTQNPARRAAVPEPVSRPGKMVFAADSVLDTEKSALIPANKQPLDKPA